MNEHDLITRSELRGELARFTDWVNEQNAGSRSRFRRLEKWMENIVGILDNDLGSLAGLVAQAESELVAQRQKIDALGAQVAEGASAQAQADHQELLDSHDKLTSVIQGLRDAVEQAQATSAGANPAAGDNQPTSGDGSGAAVVEPPTSPAAPTDPTQGTPSGPVTDPSAANPGSTGAIADGSAGTVPADGSVITDPVAQANGTGQAAPVDTSTAPAADSTAPAAPTDPAAPADSSTDPSAPADGSTSSTSS